MLRIIHPIVRNSRYLYLSTISIENVKDKTKRVLQQQKDVEQKIFNDTQNELKHSTEQTLNRLSTFINQNTHGKFGDTYLSSTANDSIIDFEKDVLTAGYNIAQKDIKKLREENEIDYPSQSFVRDKDSVVTLNNNYITQYLPQSKTGQTGHECNEQIGFSTGFIGTMLSVILFFMVKNNIVETKTKMRQLQME